MDQRMEERIKADISSIEKEIISNRRFIHMHPETGFDTQETEKFVREKLSKLGIEILESKLGVLAVVKGKSHDKRVALRADMDALELEEDSDADYKSVNACKMHACGHDAHTAMLLGAAEVLQKNKELLPMDVLLIFQPAEEGPDIGGGILVMEELKELGLAEKIKYIFAQHVFTDIPVGEVHYKAGGVMSSTDIVKIQINGKGGHAGTPHLTIDAISIGAKFISAMESYMSRRMSPFDPAVFSIGGFHAGTVNNIVAEKAKLLGTIRCLDPKTREKIIQDAETVLKGVCTAFGASYEYDILHGLPVLVCDKDATAYAAKVVKEVVGEEKVGELAHGLMGAEDFTFFANEIPASFIFLGAGNEAKGLTYPNHSPHFDIDEDCMKIGVEILCKLALNME